MSESSRSSAIYARLLALYPPEIRRAHRSEMLQNFDDLERTSSSPIALWLVLAKDLVVSVGSHWIQRVLGPSGLSLARQIRIVAAVMVLVLAIAWLRRPDAEPIVAVFCCGYLIGWASGWLRRHAVVVAALLGIALSVSVGQRYPLSLCYGCTLGWLAGWLRQGRYIRRLLRRGSRDGSAS